MNTIPISKAAVIVGRSVKTLQRWDRQGVLRAQRTKTDRRYYTEAQLRAFLGQSTPAQPRVAIAYCRVSSQAQKPDLANQRAALETFCAARGLANVDFAVEVGGGLNFKRPVFTSVIDQVARREVSHLVIAHKDRLTRFGFEWFERVCRLNDCELLILDQEKLSPETEMVQDLMTIIHCFSSRLYGLRHYKKQLKVALRPPP